MKFDFVIGNPPYQEETIGDNKGFAPPVYDKFLESAYEVADKVELIHPARFLFNAGSTPKAWNEKMLNDKHFKVMEYEEDAEKIFSNTEIKGGVAITYHDITKTYNPVHIFTKYSELNSIVSKVGLESETDSLIKVIFLQNKFDLEKMYDDHPEVKDVIGSEGKDKRFRNNIFDKVQLFTEQPVDKDDIAVIGVINNKRQWRYIPERYIDKEHENLFKWKTLVVRVNGKGALGEVLSTPIIARPRQAFTQTFIGIGACDSEEEANNIFKYIKSKFARTMLSVLKVTQDNNRDTWKMVPLQDFTSSSDIDWSVSIADIDKQLYRKYGLTDEEISFIETNVKEME